MKKQFNFTLFFCLAQFFLISTRMDAQFNGGAIALNEQRVAYRTWHLTNKRGADFLLKVSGNTLQANDNDLNNASTFVVEAGTDDANWTTPDARWFYIRSRSTGLYITVAESGALPRSVGLAEYNETAFAQQFRLISTTSASQYKLRSRLSASGPDLVLEINGAGILQADAPKADPSSEQKFAFNLAMPVGGNTKYAIINPLKGRYFSDNGILSEGTPAVQIAQTNESVLWWLQPSGDDYYWIQNSLTKQYLTMPEGANGGEDLIMTNAPAGERSEWKLNRSNANFEITNRYKDNLYISLNLQPDGDPLKVTLGIDFDQIKWFVSEMPPEPEPLTGNYEHIETANPHADCLFAYGILFKKGLCERIGLNPDQAELYFDFIREAIGASMGQNKIDEILQKFDLDNAGHRIELQLMARYYLTEILPAIPYSQWSAATTAAMAEYQTKIETVRLDFATRLQNDWDNYVAYHAANISMIDLYYYWLNADGFVWPSVYNPTAAQTELIREYTTAANTFGVRNATIVGGTFVGASLALSVVYFNTVTMNVVNLGVKLGYFFTPVVLENGLTITTTFPLQAFLLTSGPVIAVAVTAASSLALQVIEVQQLQSFLDKISDELAFAQQNVDIPQVFNGNNLLDRIKLLSDLDYIIGAPVSNGFQYHENDNAYIPPFELQCPAALTLELDNNGSATLTPAQVTGGLATPFCGNEINYHLSQSQFNCNDLSGIKTVSLNAQNSKKSQDCTFSVTVADHQKPMITCPPHTTISADENCAGLVGIRTLATKFDNCTASESIVETQSPAPSTMLNGHNTSQTVTLSATDSHANTQTCQFTVTLKDVRPATINCPPNTTLTANNSANCTVVANQISAVFGDNCTGATLSYVLSGVTTGTGNGQASGLVFNSGTSTVAYTATDGANLKADCAFTIKVNPCVNGKILWDQDQLRGVKDATVAISGDQQSSAMTDVNGVYSLALSDGANFTLTPGKNLNKLNGVNASDVQRIQQHLMGNPLNTPFKWIAADVDNNNTITSLDANILQLALLGNPGALAQFKNSWRFVPLTYGLGTPPWGFPEKINLTNTTGNQINQNFYGIKIGDVTTTTANPANSATGQPFVLQADEQWLEAGATVDVVFQAKPRADLAAFQFALHFDPERLQLTGIEPLRGLPMNKDNFGATDAGNGFLRILWAGFKSLDLATETPVFRLTFTVLEAGNALSEVLQLDDEVLPGKAFSSHFGESDVQLRYVATTNTHPGPGAPTAALLLQNQPNPFENQTQLSFVLPEACDAELRIFDGAGKVLEVRTARFAAGNHRETFDFSLVPPGILYAELRTPFGTARRKMVVTR